MKSVFILLAVAFSLAACTQKATDSSTASPADSSQPASNAAAALPNPTPDAAGQVVSDETDRSVWAKTYEGKIDGKIDVKLDLQGLGVITRGTITYKNSGKPIVVIGTMRNDGNFFLREYQPDGLITGVMSGTTKDGKLSGNWYGNEKDLSLSLGSVGTPAAQWSHTVQGSVAGKYGYHYPKDKEGNPGAEGVLTVKQSGDKVTFTFDCVTGGPGYNMAMMEDTEGTLEGNAVRYSSTEYGECAFVIRFFDGFAVVEHEDGKYDCGFGHNAGVEGEYVKM